MKAETFTTYKPHTVHGLFVHFRLFDIAVSFSFGAWAKVWKWS